MQIINHPFIGKLISVSVSVITAGLSVLLVAIAFAYCLLNGLIHSNLWGWMTGFVCLAVIPIGLMIFSVRLKKKRPDLVKYWRLTLLVLLLLPLIYLMTDAPPIQNDYTRKDILSPASNADESCRTLMAFRKDGGLQFNNFSDDFVETNRIGNRTFIRTNIINFAEDVDKAWLDIDAGRKIIEKLDSFEGISDLPQDYTFDSIGRSDLKSFVLNRITIIDVFRTYLAYSIVKTEQGEPVEGVKHLVQFHSVIRKMMPYSGLLINKMIGVAIISCDIDTAYRIANSSNSNENVVRLLAQGFPPLGRQDVSLRNCFIAEYLYQDVAQNTFTSTNISMLFAPIPYNTLIHLSSQRPVGNLILGVEYNRNVTLNELKRIYQLAILGQANEMPDCRLVNDYLESFRRRVPIKNMMGWGVISLWFPDYSKSIKKSVETKVLSDLLALELHRRLGEKIELMDFYSPQQQTPYRQNAETGHYFSVGPDGKPGTEDDIRLGAVNK